MAEKTPEQIVEDINTGIETIKADLAKASTKEDVTTLKTELNALIDANKGVTEAQKAELADLQEQINVMKENQGSVDAKTKGSYTVFVEKNVEENKDIQNDRNYTANLTIKAPALMTTANVTPNVTDGFNPLFGNYIDSEIGSVPKPEPFILPLITVTNQPGTESIWYVDRVNEEGDAEFIGEGDLKPLVDAEWKSTKAPIKEVAERWKFSKRLMNHAPSIVSNFREHANELIENKIDDELVTGDNLGNNLNGIETIASAFIVPTQLANYYTDANIYDAINSMATRVRLSNFKGQLTCVLNTVWKAQMQGLKKTDGEYIVPPFVTQDGNTVGEVRVVFTNKFADTKIMVGDLKKFKAVFAENIQYDEGYENDDFSRNLVSRKLEAFLGTYIKDSDAGAIISDDVATVLTAINAL
jgi:hypothetical protein